MSSPFFVKKCRYTVLYSEGDMNDGAGKALGPQLRIGRFYIRVWKYGWEYQWKSRGRCFFFPWKPKPDLR